MRRGEAVLEPWDRPTGLVERPGAAGGALWARIALLDANRGLTGPGAKGQKLLSFLIFLYFAVCLVRVSVLRGRCG